MSFQASKSTLAWKLVKIGDEMALHKQPQIIGIGTVLGSVEITNKELEQRQNLASGTIERKTGINRRFACDQNENLYTLAARAVEKAINCTDYSVGRGGGIDGIFFGCNPTGDYLMPNHPSILANILGYKKIRTFDAGSGCAAGVSALQLAYNQLVVDTLEGRESVYAVVAGDHTSRITRDHSTDRWLFSDSAGAVILSNRDSSPLEVGQVEMTTFPQGAQWLALRSSSGILEHNGKAVYEFAISQISSVAKEQFGYNGLKGQTYLVPHQANLHILNHLEEQCAGIRVYKEGIKNTGNTLGASVIFGLEDTLCNNLQGPSTHIVLLGFGEGMSVGTACLDVTGNLADRELTDNYEDPAAKERYWNIYQEKWGGK